MSYNTTSLGPEKSISAPIPVIRTNVLPEKPPGICGEIKRARDFRIGDLNRFRRILADGNNLKGSLWVADPGSKYWTRVFNGTIKEGTYIDVFPGGSETWFNGFPVGFNGKDLNTLKINSDSYVLLDLEMERPSETLARSLCAKNSKLQSIEKTVEIKNDYSHLQELNDFANLALERFKVKCREKRFFEDEAVVTRDDIKRIRVEAPSVNIYSPNLRVILQRGGEEIEIFNLFEHGSQGNIEDIAYIGTEYDDSKNMFTYLSINDESNLDVRIPPEREFKLEKLQSGEKLKFIVEYPNAV